MIAITTLTDSVKDTAPLVGYFIGFVTLYTGVIANTRAREEDRSEPVAETLRSLRGQLVCLIGITSAGFIGMYPITRDVLATVDTHRPIDPALWLFAATVPLLLVLLPWQASLLGQCQATPSERADAATWWIPAAVVDAIAVVVVIVGAAVK